MDGKLGSPSKSDRLLIVDGHAYAYRAFHAIRHLTSPSGAPTNAIYGFIKMLRKMQAFVAPSHVAVIWDGGLSPERQAALPEYKMQRPPMPVDLEQQLEGINFFLKASGLASFCREAVEADDWIATLARQAVPEGFSVVIASSDKDFMQLVSPEVGLLNANDKMEKIWTAEDVRAKAAVNPDQIVDWLSMIGDSVDNIPGVPGVGPKTASDLLSQFDSIDSLYLRLGEVKSDRLRANLLASEEVVRRNQKLIRLLDELPFACLFDDVKIGKPDFAQLGLCYAEWGFKSLLAEVNTVASSQQELW